MTAITSNRRRKLQLGTALATCIACAGLSQVAFAQSLPVVDNAGGANISTPNADTLRVDLRNVNRVIDWTSFDVGGGKEVNFVSTIGGTANTVLPFAVLNRVTGTGVSDINGAITSQNNIKVWIANPNGIVFGNGGSFSGGSLVLTTLGDGSGTGNVETAFANSNLGIAARLSGTSTKAIEIKAGSSLGTAADPLSGSVLAIAQEVVVGGRIQAEGNVDLVAASDVRFTPSLGSPLSFTILAGSTLSGVHVVGTGNVNGANVQVVAGTVDNMLNNLLQIDEGAQLIATDNDGSITLTAVTTGGATQSLIDPQIETQAVLTAGSAGNVTITSSGTATVGGTIVAGRDIELTAQNGGKMIVPAQLRAGRDLSITAANIALGTGTLPVFQSGGRNVDIVAANGAITGDAGLVLRLNTGANPGASRILIDAGSGGTVAFNPSSRILAVGTGANSARAPIGIRYDGASNLTLGDVTASRLGDYTGSVQNELTGTGDFAASTILTDETFEAQFGGSIKLVGVTVSDPNEDVILNAGGALETAGLIEATRDVDLTAGGTATIRGAVNAGDDFAVQGADVKLGDGSDAITQRAVGTVLVTAGAGGTITGDAGLTLRSNRNANAAGSSLILDASNTGTIDFALGSTIAAGSTATNATNAAIGVRFDRSASGSDLALGAVTASRLGDYTGGSTIAATLTGGGDLVARTIVTNQAFDATFAGAIKVNSINTSGNTADVTLRAGGPITGNQTNAPAISIDAGRNITLSAGTDVTMGVIRGNDLTAAAGAPVVAPAVRQAGSLSLVDADVSGDIDLTAWGSAIGGQIRVTTALAGGTLTLDNSSGGGTSGSIKVANRLQSDGNLQLRSAGDILVARYTGSGTTGTVISANGAIDATAAGSVLGYIPTSDTAASAFVIGEAGIGSIVATGDLTVTTAAQSDVAIGSLSAGGALTVNIDGNLYGRTQATTQVPGTSFNGKTSVTVGASTANGVINLARVDSAGPVQLTASEIAVGTLASGGATTLTAPGARTYVGEQRITGNATLTLGSTFADVGTTTATNFYANATNLSAQDALTVNVTRAAQLGTVNAGGPVAITTGGMVAGTITSSDAGVSLTATSGTLALNTATAATGIAIAKRGGSVLSAQASGNTVRFATLTAGTDSGDAVLGDVRVTSQTHIRGNRIDANGGNVDLAAGFDTATSAIDQAGEITGLTGGKMRVTATDLADVTGDGRIVTRSGGLTNFSTLDAASDISILAGGAAAPLNGAVRIDDATAGGNLTIGNQNTAAGSVTGIAFGTLQADGDVTLITGIGNGGGATGQLIDAGGNARLAVTNILVDRIVAGDDVALLAASGRISDSADTASSSGIKLQAGGGIAADAGLSLRVDTAEALAGDVALRATGDLTAKTITAGDDATVRGANVRLGTVTSTGSASDATDVSFTTLTAISDPNNPGLVGSVPTIGGAQLPANIGGNVFVTATTGDVTGLPDSATVLPALNLVTTGNVLSTAYGLANLEARARNGSVTVSAADGAQLGTVAQGTAATGTGNGSITIMAKAISADAVNARTGSASLTSSQGTLVVGSVSAFDTAQLLKGLADPAAAVLAGNEIRFDSVSGGQGQTDVSALTAVAGERLGVIVDSATAVRGDTVTASLGGARIVATLGPVEGRDATALAIDASGAGTLQNVTVRSATAITLADVLARDRISIIAGGSGSQAGSISLDDARSTGGSVYLTSINTVAGSASDITYDTLGAVGEIVAITSGSNRGSVSRLGNASVPFAIDAGTNVAIDAKAMDLGTVRAGTGTIALNAADFITADDLRAGGAIAGLAGGTITLGSARADAGDVAFQAGGVLTIGSATASDDIALSGSSVRIGTAEALGGADVANANFAALGTIVDPSADGVSGAVPGFAGAAELAGSSILVSATNDVTGLAVDPLVTPALTLVTTGTKLSNAYGTADLTAAARNGSIVVTAANGGAQLGSVQQGTAASGAGAGFVTVTARAISAGTVQAGTGAIDLRASQGTLVLGTVEAGGSVSILKRGGSIATAGDEVRFTTIKAGTLGSAGMPGEVSLLSQTHVRGQSVDAIGGNATIRAGYDDVSGSTTQAGEVTGVGFTAAAPTAISVTATNLRISSGGRGEYGDLDASADLSVTAGGAAPLLDGAIRIGSAQAGGNLYVSSRNSTPGSIDGIGFDTLGAGGDVVLLTGFTNGGDVTGSQVSAGGGVRISSGAIAIDGITATGDAALMASAGSIAVDTLMVGAIGANASGAIDLGSAEATSGDLALLAGGAIRATSLIAADDVSLSGASLGLGTVTARGSGNDSSDVDFENTSTAFDPADPGFTGAIPTVNGAKQAASSGGNIFATARAGDISVSDTATAQGSALFGATGAVAIASGSATTGTIGILAGGDVNSTIALRAREDVAIRSGGAVTLALATAGDDLTVDAVGTIAIDSTVLTGLGAGATDVTFGSAPALGLGSASLPGNVVSLTSTSGDIALGAVAFEAPASGGSVSLSAASGALTIARDLAVQGGLTILAGGDVTLGDAQDRTQSATGGIAITSIGGAIRQGSGRLVLAANRDGSGSEALTLAAKTEVALGTADLSGGTARQSAVSVTAGDGGIAIGSATGATFTATAGTDFKANGAIAAGTAALGADTSAPTVGIIARNGSIVATTIDANEAGHDVLLQASNAITLDRVTAARSIDATGLGGVTANALAASSGTLTVVSAGAIGVGSSTSGEATSYTTSTGSTTFGTLNAGGMATISSGGGVTGTALVSGGAASVTSGGALALGRLAASGAVGVTTATSAKIDQLASGGPTTVKAGTDVTLGTVTSAGDTTIAAKSLVALNGAFNAAGKALTLTAKDATIGGDVTAATIRVINDAAAGNSLVLGDNATGTGFTLSAAEVGRLKATTTLTFDSVSAPVKQDVSIGSLALAGPAKVLILADGTRIDVTGRIDVSGATTDLQLGGSAENAGLASVLRVAAKPDGTGGSIAAPLANVSLRAANIAFGQDAGFLSALGVTGSGTGDTTVALAFNDRASSTLYFAAANGGAFYTPSAAGVKLLTANNLTLSYTNFALFQNTGAQGQTSGVDVGTFLTANANGDRPVLGLFGTLAGREGTAASLLSGLAYQINLNDGRSSRINGCVVGGGAGCLVTLVFSPNLAAIDSVRPLLFTVASDYEVPFNPLIGTNNDALFGDVGTSGLENIPLEPIECSDPQSPQCRTQPQPASAVQPATPRSPTAQPEPAPAKEAQ